MDFGQSLLNFFLITLLGLLIAFSPMIVVVNVLVVLKSKRPILRTVILMAGMAAPLLIVAGLAALFLDANTQVSLRGLNERINIPPLINLAFGLWVIVLGLRRIKYSNNNRGPKKTANLIMKHPPDKYSALFWFAFIKSSLSVTNLFAILLVSKLVIANKVTQPLATIAILWAILIGLVPFGVILYFYFFKHERLEHLSDQVDGLLNRNLDRAINLGLLILGGAFSVSGVIHLLSR